MLQNKASVHTGIPAVTAIEPKTYDELSLEYNLKHTHKSHC